MKEAQPEGATPFNPPLRIFTATNCERPDEGNSADHAFPRPKLQRHVTHDRVARYFAKRRSPFGSPLD